MPGRNYRLSPIAEADLEDIWLYTFRSWSAEQADAYHRDLVTAFGDLATGRKIGRTADIREGYFKYLSGSHVIYFRQAKHGIDVIRVLHVRMDVNRHL
jgi:toxin ParE1/3/4